MPIATANSASIDPPNSTPCVKAGFNCPEIKASKNVLIALPLAVAFTILALAVYAVRGIIYFWCKR
jgi:hypothetical protein